MSEIIITSLITSISTLSAAFIGGYFMYKSNQKKDELEKITKNSYRYLNEIKSFYELENEYIKEIEKLTQKKQDTIKKENRAKLREKPKMTFNSAQIALDNNRYLDLKND